MKKMFALVGLMGTGKSTLGRGLAEAMGCAFVDSDSEIETQAGKSIAEIFADEGESAFRALEANVLQSLVQKHVNDPAVLATGGGAVMNPNSLAMLKARCTLCWLKADPTNIIKQLKGGYDPAIASKTKPASRTGGSAGAAGGLVRASAYSL